MLSTAMKTLLSSEYSIFWQRKSVAFCEFQLRLNVVNNMVYRCFVKRAETYSDSEHGEALSLETSGYQKEHRKWYQENGKNMWTHSIELVSVSLNKNSHLIRVTRQSYQLWITYGSVMIHRDNGFLQIMVKSKHK